MTDHTKKERERNLREIFRTMAPHRAQEIREAYYKAVEGLSTLANPWRSRTPRWAARTTTP